MNEPQERMPITLGALASSLAHVCSLDEAMHVIEAARREYAGEGLITINVVKSVARAGGTVCALELERIWSSQPDAWPVRGGKHKGMTPWTRQVFCENRVFCAEGDAALAETFDDSALILSLGLHAAINVPLPDRDGRCQAAFNVLGCRPVWTPGEVALMQQLAALAAPFVARHLACLFAQRRVDIQVA